MRLMKMFRWQVAWAASLALVGVSGPFLARAEDEDTFFERAVRPVLAGNCFRCHGGQKVSGDLRVDGRDALLEGGGNGPAIVPGNPDESLLMRAIRREDGVEAMPPGQPLRNEEVEAISRWIRTGAVWPKASAPFDPKSHWSLQPLEPIEPPRAREVGWVRTSIDPFVKARLEEAGVRPTPEADRRTWMRRVTYDLIGMPPSVEEVDAFASDEGADAFERVVDRLLASVRHGERWGRHWLDVVRYADTAGENSDHPLPHAWKYRNWVIASFNEDRPYDEFARAQVAGDLLAEQGREERYADGVIATGYLALARRFGHDIDKDMYLTHEDVIDNLGKTFLGLSLGCARCHDHKNDPITTEDYYALYGIFSSTKFAFPGCEPKQQPRDLVPLISRAEYARTIEPILAEARTLDTAIEAGMKDLASAATAARDAATRARLVLASELVADGSSSTVGDEEGQPAGPISVDPGDVIQLALDPRGDQGADTTRVKLLIQEEGGDGRRWSVEDLIDDLTRGNPFVSNPSEPWTWLFLDATDGFAPLTEGVEAIDGRSELKAWRSGGTPSVLVNTSRESVKVWTSLSPRSLFVHPGPNGPVAIAWRSPISGHVRISVEVSDAHPGGNGVAWSLERYNGVEAHRAYELLAERTSGLLSSRHRRGTLSTRLDVPVAYGVTEGEVADSRIQKRGNPEDLGEVVARRFPEALGGQLLREPTRSGREELAEWLTGPSNPLTARVIVNRVWQGHFGRGLVATPNDFGTRGSPPVDQALLDSLATELIRHGWSLKWLHREIVLSAAYRMDSRAESVEPSGQPRSVFQAFPRRRLTAEEIRDTLLSLSGELDSQPGGSHPFPPEASWSFSQHAPFAAEYPSRKRSVYSMQKRNRRDRFLVLFDGADPNASTASRDETTVPTQSLFFLNDPEVHRYADAIARRTLEPPRTDEASLDLLYGLVLGRHPSGRETAAAGEFERAYVESLADSPADKRLALARAALVRILLASNEFLYVD